MRYSLPSFLFFLGCGGSISETPDASSDRDVVDANISDTPGEPGDTGTGDTGTYNDLTNTNLWSSLDLTPLVHADNGFGPGVFDGRYVYWQAPAAGVGNVLVRYDTQQPFKDLSAWSKWDAGSVSTFAPIAFDGRYVYTGIVGGVQQYKQTRLDIQGTFGDFNALSSSPTNPGQPDGGAFGLDTAAFDGRYVYFTFPTATRFDTMGKFNFTAPWTLFEPAGTGWGTPAIFANPYVVITPWKPPTAVVLYDTRLPFTDNASWSTFPLLGVTGDELYAGCGGDGRYVYFVPYANSKGERDGLVARYDTSASVTNVGSWQTFQTTQLLPSAKGFDHASWDGRYFYFMTGKDTSATAVIARYDTTKDFKSASSWSAFDMAPLVPPHNPATEFGGGVVFDGEYIYVPANYGPIIMRFDARTPRKMPPGFSGMFY